MLRKLASLLLILALLNSCSSSIRIFGRGQFTPPEPFLATVSYTTVSKLIIVEARLEGESYRFLFDTGAPMVISKALSRKLKMKRLVRKRVRDSQGYKQYLNYVALPDLELAGKFFQNLTAIEADLDASALLYCLNLDGIIGANMMQLAYWQINPDRNTLRFTNNWEKLKPDSSAAVIPFRTKATRSPVITAYLDSIVARAITFDTGSSGVLGLPRLSDNSYFEDENAVLSVGYHSGGLFGSRQDSITTVLRPFKVGSLPEFSIPVEVERPGSKSLLGMGFIKNYRTTLNWQSKSIYMEPLQDSVIIEQRSFGLSPFLQDSVLIVGKCLPQRFALNNVPTVGDTIISLNGQNVYPLQKDGFCAVIEEYRNNDTLNIEIKNRGQFRLVVSEIFTPVAPLEPLAPGD